MTYDYFDNGDGSYFRRERKPDGPSWTGYPVRDIWTRYGWQPYRGDRLKPVAFGSRITIDDLPLETLQMRGSEEKTGRLLWVLLYWIWPRCLDTWCWSSYQGG